jgi:hypothetical protein
MSTKPLINLDFDQIKQSIIDYIKSDPTFSDYNFEGSALNSIADILAYNTHTNAYYTSMLYSESFLDSAQRRSSVVSKAKELGYVPRSSVGAAALVDISIPVTGLNNTETFFLPRGTVFQSTNENGSYTFLSAENVSSAVVSGNHVFSSVKIVAGTKIVNSFTVNKGANLRSIFAIPNTNIDTSTLKVYVKDDQFALTRTEYFRVDSIFDLTATSKVYFLQESYDGHFEIYFGDDILGKAPVDNNVVEADYFITSKIPTDPNGCSNFYSDVSFSNGTVSSIYTSQVAYGGAERESLSSIKFNAVNYNSTKNRIVTVLDYKNYITRNYSFIKSVAAWGGDLNSPPVYGKVFLSLEPVTGYVLSTASKDAILKDIKQSSMLTVTPEILDPEYIYVALTVNVKFNRYKTNTTKNDLSVMLKTAVDSYIDSISIFDTDYINSNLISSIQNLDVGISGVDVDKTVSFNLFPYLGIEVNHIKECNNAMVSGSVSSTKFKTFVETEKIVTIKEIPNSTFTKVVSGSTYTYNYLGMYSDGVLVKNIGTINLNTGKLDITMIVSSYLSSTSMVNVSFSTVNSDIISSRNNILTQTISSDAAIGLKSTSIIIENYER